MHAAVRNFSRLQRHLISDCLFGLLYHAGFCNSTDSLPVRETADLKKEG
jgi:hypothetical protein